MAKRFIRLKELPVGQAGHHVPSAEYLEATDGSLPQRTFEWATDDSGYLLTGAPRFGRQRLYLLGDSFVESMFSDPYARFAAGLERHLRAAGAPIDVVNAGYSGSTSLQVLNVLLNKIAAEAREDDLVVVFFPQSDASAILGGGGYWGDSTRYAAILPPVPSRARAPRQQGVEDSAAVAEITAHAARALGLRVVLAVSPFRRGDFSNDALLRRIYRRDRSRYESVLQFRLAFGDAIRAVAARQRLHCLDLDVLLAAQPHLLYDELHLNEQGQSFVAEHVASQLMQAVRALGEP